MIHSLLQSQISLFQQFYSGATLSPWIGASPYPWAESVKSGIGGQYSLSKKPLSRLALRALWADQSQPVEACFLSTMAWGGMRRGNARRAWEARSHWLPICHALRQGEHTRATGFSAFSALRAKGELPGVGPAYFTKILYFSAPSADAYILDQWTARSIHTLTGQGVFPATRKDYASVKLVSKLGDPSKLRKVVDDKVSVEDYLSYCRQVEQLAELLDLSPHQTEERLFSSGGRAPHPWRAHVMTAWSQPTGSLYI